jgi:beta-apo-4'-carotenal oxygenase
VQIVLNQTRSGGASLNDGFTHITIPGLPFGGVGTSGQGSYHGKASYEAFTHRRSITKTPGWIEGMLAVRYPPFTAKKQKQFEGMGVKKPNFDRACRTLGWSSWFMSLLGFKSLVAVIGKKST